MNAYIPTREDLQDIIREAVQETVDKTLPSAIRKATRKEWLTTDDVMEIMDCSRRHVQHLRDSDQIPYSKNGRVIRYNADEFDQFMKDHKA